MFVGWFVVVVVVVVVSVAAAAVSAIIVHCSGQAASIQGVAAHLEHQIAGAHVAHDLKGRESEAALVAQGILHSRTYLPCVFCSPMRELSMVAAPCPGTVLCCGSAHGTTAASIQGATTHLEHAIAGAHVSHDLKHRETEKELAARGVLHTGTLL